MTSFIDQLEAEYEARQTDGDGERATTEIGGATVTMGDAETTQSTDDGESFLTGSNLRGTPRGKEAREAREISETAPFQMILNAVTDQLLGGELAFPSDDDEEDSAEAELKPLVADVLDGPHYGGADFDDLVSAWVADMAGPGNAYAEFIGSEDVDLPFVALKDVDPLTVRHNVDESGGFKETAFYQAPFRTLAGQELSPSEADVTPRDQDDLTAMS